MYLQSKLTKLVTPNSLNYIKAPYYLLKFQQSALIICISSFQKDTISWFFVVESAQNKQKKPGSEPSVPGFCSLFTFVDFKDHSQYARNQPRASPDNHFHLQTPAFPLFRCVWAIFYFCSVSSYAGRLFCVIYLLSSKKSFSRAAHSSSSTPAVSTGAWLKGMWKKFATLPQHPALWSAAP